MRKQICGTLKMLILGFALLSLLSSNTRNLSEAAVRVRGHLRKSGTYVYPHTRSHPDKSHLNNWSTKGNANPYTGKRGRKLVTP